MFPLVVLRTTIPFLCRAIEGDNPFDIGVGGWIFSSAQAFLILTLVLNNYAFVMAGVIDFSRRYFMIRSVGALLTPEKDKTRLAFLPTINFLSPASWYAWIKMRSCFTDFGQKYYARIIFYCSTFLAINTVFLVLHVLSWFEFIQLRFPFTMSITIFYDFILIGSVLFAMLLFGAYTNYEFIS